MERESLAFFFWRLGWFQLRNLICQLRIRFRYLFQLSLKLNHFILRTLNSELKILLRNLSSLFFFTQLLPLLFNNLNLLTQILNLNLSLHHLFISLQHFSLSLLKFSFQLRAFFTCRFKIFFLYLVLIHHIGVIRFDLISLFSCVLQVSLWLFWGFFVWEEVWLQRQRFRLKFDNLGS